MEQPRFFYGRMRDALQSAGQSDTSFFLDQLERCYEALSEACKTATRDRYGKPIFYYIFKGEGEAKGIRLMSFHYVCAYSGRVCNLNYITAILLNGIALFEPREGVLVDKSIYSDGANVIRSLSIKLNLGKKSPYLISATEI